MSSRLEQKWLQMKMMMTMMRMRMRMMMRGKVDHVYAIHVKLHDSVTA